MRRLDAVLSLLATETSGQASPRFWFPFAQSPLRRVAVISRRLKVAVELTDILSGMDAPRQPASL